MQRAQSAMEYLMTYGWSILIIAIVIAALFVLGVFNGTGSGGASACVALSGWQCTGLQLYSSGALSATIGEVGQTVTITGTACSSNSTSPAAFNSMPGVTVSSGQTAQLNFNCPGAVGQIGKAFTGSIWIRYNTQYRTGIEQMIANLKAYVASGGTGPTVGYVAEVPITVTNANTVAGTGSNFQQMIYFNPQNSLYTANEASDLGNIRFYQGGTELYSWCESGCNTISSTNAVFWVNIAGGIAANSNVVINMTFLSNTMDYDGLYAGEAPQWTCTNPSNTMSGCSTGQYAKFDNGKSVFTIYSNFAGLSLPGGWTSNVGTVGQDTFNVANRIIIKGGGSSSSHWVQVANTTGISAPIIGEAYLTTNAATGGSGSYQAFSLMDGTNSLSHGLSVDLFGGSIQYGTYSAGGTGSSTPNLFAWGGIDGVAWQSASSGTYYYNYTRTPFTFTSGTYSSTQYLTLGPFSWAASMTSITQWARARAYPPGGIMPTTSFGSITG